MSYKTSSPTGAAAALLRSRRVQRRRLVMNIQWRVRAIRVKSKKHKTNTTLQAWMSRSSGGKWCWCTRYMPIFCQCRAEPTFQTLLSYTLQISRVWKIQVNQRLVKQCYICILSQASAAECLIPFKRSFRPRHLHVFFLEAHILVATHAKPILAACWTDESSLPAVACTKVPCFIPFSVFMSLW